MNDYQTINCEDEYRRLLKVERENYYKLQQYCNEITFELNSYKKTDYSELNEYKRRLEYETNKMEEKDEEIRRLNQKIKEMQFMIDYNIKK